MRSLYIDSLKEGLADLLTNDDRIYLLGEDITEPYGGSFKVTKSLSTKFPGRLLATPMSEQGITGFAVGMALGGLKPIVEIMFGDFLTLTLDQLLNHASKFVGLYNAKMHLVVRTPMGGHRGYGATHSQSIERLVFGIPNIDVVAPSILHSPGHLLNESIEKGGIVVFIENKLDYARNLLPSDESENILSIRKQQDSFPLAISEIIDSGESPDVVMIAYGGAVPFVLEAQKELFMEDEIAIKLISPSRIDTIDTQEILKEIGSSSIVYIAEEGISDFGWAEHVATLLRESGYKGIIGRIGSKNEVIGASEEEENRVLLTSDKIKEGIHELLGY